MPHGELSGFGRGNSVMMPFVVVRPILPAAFREPKHTVGPNRGARRAAVGCRDRELRDDAGGGYPPDLVSPDSVNQSAPSGPVTIPLALLPKVGILNSVMVWPWTKPATAAHRRTRMAAHLSAKDFDAILSCIGDFYGCQTLFAQPQESKTRSIIAANRRPQELVQARLSMRAGRRFYVRGSGFSRLARTMQTIDGTR